MMKFQSPDFILHHSDFKIPSAAIRLLVSKAITTEGEIIDVFSAAGASAPTARDMPDQAGAASYAGNALGMRHHFIEP